MGDQENCFSIHIMKWNINIQERNYSHVKGDQNNASGNAENIAELCFSIVAGNNFKVLGDGHRICE